MCEFVTYEISKKLKEKGFKEPCFGWYYPSEVCDYDYRTLIIHNCSECRVNRHEDLLISHNDDRHIDAPTISQVLKWLRDEKDIFIEITVDVNDKFNYYFEVFKKGDDTWDHIGQNDTYDYFESYEEASLAGIEYVLDNLI